jgi:AMP deaminase
VEWDILAAWVVANNLASNNVVWLVQIPRLYNVYRDQGIIENFAQVCPAVSPCCACVACTDL